MNKPKATAISMDYGSFKTQTLIYLKLCLLRYTFIVCACIKRSQTY